MPARVCGDLGRPERHCWLRWSGTLPALAHRSPSLMRTAERDQPQVWMQSAPIALKIVTARPNDTIKSSLESTYNIAPKPEKLFALYAELSSHDLPTTSDREIGNGTDEEET